MKSHKKLIEISNRLFTSLLLSVLLFSCSDGPTEFNQDDFSSYDGNKDTELSLIELNLRVHIMKDIVMPHATGVIMDAWVSPDDVRERIVPEMNAIWDQAKIKWVIESVIEEDVVKGDTYDQSLNFLIHTKRDAEGHSDPARLPHLYSLMQEQNRSKADELGKNLFHIYLFPFVGNTSQGNAMSGFDYHCILGTWSNKHNGGGAPEKSLLSENHNQFIRGSIGRTASHELGHVLNLRHDECISNCLMGGGSNGYSLSEAQINEARFEAINRTLN
jgi:hypothetical protein